MVYLDLKHFGSIPIDVWNSINNHGGSRHPWWGCHSFCVCVCVCRTRSQQRKKTKKKTQSCQKQTEKSFLPTSETPEKHLRRCLARSSKLGHAQNTKNKRAATTRTLNIVCSKPPSKVRAIGTRRLLRVKEKKRETKQNERHQTNNKESTKHHHPPTTTEHGETKV